jgi:hypothetical protein
MQGKSVSDVLLHEVTIAYNAEGARGKLLKVLVAHRSCRRVSGRFSRGRLVAVKVEVGLEDALMAG